MSLNADVICSAKQWCSVGHTQVYGVYPLIFQSALSIPTTESPLILSDANQPFKRLFTKETAVPWTTCKVFHVWMDSRIGLRNSSLKMPNCVVVSACSLAVSQY